MNADPFQPTDHAVEQPHRSAARSDDDAAPGLRSTSTKPLADRMRPRSLEEVVGQSDLLRPGGPLRCLLEADQPLSLLFWGPPGCGKTTVGRELARIMDGSHVDTDELITEQAGQSIAEIFEAEGEAGFRKREAAVVAQVFASPPDVVSVGGGVVLDDANVTAIRAAATVVWLTAPAEVLWQRISADSATDVTRPSLTDRPGLDEVKRLLDERTPLYSRVSDHTLDTTDRTPGEVAIEVRHRAHPA